MLAEPGAGASSGKRQSRNELAVRYSTHYMKDCYQRAKKTDHWNPSRRSLSLRNIFYMELFTFWNEILGQESAVPFTHYRKTRPLSGIETMR